MKPTTTEDIYALLSASVDSAALVAAMELGVFWRVAERAQEAGELSRALGVPLNRCRYWLEILLELGLLEREDQSYALSSVARRTIVDAMSEESWAHFAAEWRKSYPMMQDLSRTIREPGSVLDVLGLSRPSYFEQLCNSPDHARRFTRMLYELHLDLAEEIADKLDMTGVQRFMDLGGGSGVVSLALLRRHPEARSVIVDIENVCAAGRAIVAEHAEGNRISYHAANFDDDDLPGGFDLVLECDICVHTRALLGKLRGSLYPGGRLVIVDYFAPAEDVAPPPRLRWAFQGSLENPDFSYTTADEVCERMVDAGFQLGARIPLSDHATLMEAHL